MGWFSSLVGGVVGFFIGGPVGAVIGAGIGATKVGEKIVNTVIEFVTQPFMGALGNFDAPGEAERQQGVLVQKTGSVQNIPVVYGYRKVAGVVSFAETGATNNKYLYVAYVFAEGLVEGLREVYIDDWLLPVAQVANLNAGQLVTINADKYKDRVQMRWYPGAYFANPRTSTVGTQVKGDIFAEAPSFISDMVYNGLAVLFVRYEWKEIKTQADADANPFSGNIPEIQVGLLGKRVASLTTAASETQTYDSTPVRYSTNPAECLLDYLRNPRYGKGLINSDIHWDTWRKAAGKCNQTVTYITGVTGPILTMNAVIDSSQTIMSNTKMMLQNFRGYMPYVQGRYKLRIEDAGNDTDILSGVATIVQTFTKDDIVSDITYVGIDKGAKYNVVAVTYVDPDQKFSNQVVVYPETEAERQTFIDRDGGRENKQDITLGCITNYAIAKDFARLLFNKSRRQESCVFTATSKALELEPGDIIAIQSNLLNFGIDPWRVVSIKINGDMTVDLGCVRNPDDIYPHTRVGEEDIVLPTYIPKGSIIYFPGSSNLPLLGLVPPTSAVFPSDVQTGTVTNPTPTNPAGPTGGGVGGSTNTGSNTATPPPPPPPLDHILTVVSAKRVAGGGTTFSFDITFRTPSYAQYSKTLMWFRPNPALGSPWKLVELTDNPGANATFGYTLGPLPQGVYDIYLRVVYADGANSTRVNQTQVTSRGDALELQQNALLGQTQTTVGAGGWAPSNVGVIETPRFDSNIDLLEIRPVLQDGEPSQPSRKMKVVINQLVQIGGESFLNYGISGVTVYWRESGTTYWEYQKYDWPANYSPGQQQEFVLNGDFGPRQFPNTFILTSLQSYDFLVRLNYTDGTPAQKQLYGTGALVEVFNGLRDFVSFGTSPYASRTSKNIAVTPAPSGLGEILTVDQAPNATTGLDTLPSVIRVSCGGVTRNLRWFFNIPPSSKFRGFAIRFRPIVSGASPAFTEMLTSYIPDQTVSQIIFDQANNFEFGTLYDWVITAQVMTPSGIVDATQSLAGRGRVTAGTSSTTLYNEWNFAVKETKVALEELRATFPDAGVITVQSWDKIYEQSIPAGSTLPASEFRLPANANATQYKYYRLRFQLPASAIGLICYRRVFSSNGMPSATNASIAKYFGIGRWERIRITGNDITPVTVNGQTWYEVNFRAPTDHREFNNVLGGNLYRAKFFAELPDLIPYAGLGNNNPISTTNPVRHEYLFVIEDQFGLESANGLLLRDFSTIESGAGFANTVSGLTVGNVQQRVVTRASFNNLDAGFDRNLSEARPFVPWNKLAGPYMNPNWPIRVNSVSTYFLAPSANTTTKTF
jgi:hypothetical protein